MSFCRRCGSHAPEGILEEARRVIKKRPFTINDLSYLRGLCYCVGPGYEDKAMDHIWERALEKLSTGE